MKRGGKRWKGRGRTWKGDGEREDLVGGCGEGAEDRRSRIRSGRKGCREETESQKPSP